MKIMKLNAINYKAPNAAELFVESLKETGFGVLKNTPICPELLDNFYKKWLQLFFSKQANEKLEHLSSVDQHGFFPADQSETAKGHGVKDIKEFFQYYPKYATCPETLQSLTHEYFSLAKTIATELLGWIEKLTPTDVQASYSIPLSEMIQQSEHTMLRILHYPPMTGQEEPGAIRAAAHEDICLLTLLPAANEPGLQVLSKDGTWLDVPCDSGNLIVNIGDMLQEASQGYFPSTTHRVINPTGQGSNTSRISIPLFLHPQNDVVLSEQYTAGSFLTERLQELGLI
jgi:isopenicillin N synthase-like dioxygenase